MAKLKGLKERQLALKDINSKLKLLVPVNEFLNAENPSGIYTVSFDGYRASLLCKDGEAIRELVLNYKKELVSEIRDLAVQHSIEFEAEEEAMLK